MNRLIVFLLEQEKDKFKSRNIDFDTEFINEFCALSGDTLLNTYRKVLRVIALQSIKDNDLKIRNIQELEDYYSIVMKQSIKAESTSSTENDIEKTKINLKKIVQAIEAIAKNRTKKIVSQIDIASEIKMKQPHISRILNKIYQHSAYLSKDEESLNLLKILIKHMPNANRKISI